MRGTEVLIYVIDSNDRERIGEAVEELEKLLREDELRDAILLVFANKQDLPRAMSIPELIDKLSLYSLRNREWHLQPTCAITSEGLFEGIEWISKTIKKNQSK